MFVKFCMERGMVQLCSWSSVWRGHNAVEIEAIADCEGLSLAIEWCRRKVVVADRVGCDHV
jgi:hypothetical protein